MLGKRLNFCTSKQEAFDGRIINVQINASLESILEPLKHFYKKKDSKIIKIYSIKNNRTRETHKHTITDLHTIMEDKNLPAHTNETDDSCYSQRHLHRQS